MFDLFDYFSVLMISVPPQPKAEFVLRSVCVSPRVCEMLACIAKSVRLWNLLPSCSMTALAWQIQ